MGADFLVFEAGPRLFGLADEAAIAAIAHLGSSAIHELSNLVPCELTIFGKGQQFRVLSFLPRGPIVMVSSLLQIFSC